jgi:hypothetical protein
MDIDEPPTRIPDTQHKHKTDPAIDNPITSSSTIFADRAEVPEPHSRPTPTPIYFSARLAEKRGCTIDDQASVHTIYTVDSDANPDPANIEDTLSRWDYVR